jgi:hypothetical protein
MQIRQVRKSRRRRVWQLIRQQARHRTIWWQIAKMRVYCPQFDFRAKRTRVTWVGTLTPDERAYQVRIYYKEYEFPVVHIVSPPIPDDAPHIYHDRDNALCLFYPKHNEWTSDRYVCDTIVPWTSEWLYYYEIWQVTGKWFGKEAPHQRK